MISKSLADIMDKLLCFLGLHTPNNVDIGDKAFCIHCHKKLRDKTIWPRE